MQGHGGSFSCYLDLPGHPSYPKDRASNNFLFIVLSIALSLGLDLNVLIEQKRRNIGYLSRF